MDSENPKHSHCTPCKTDGKKKNTNIYCMDCEAYFCEECFKFHKKVPHLAKHVILKNEEIDIWTKVTYKCKRHERPFEVYCEEHRDFCCQECVFINHRSCEQMKFIQEHAAIGKKSKKILQKTDKQLDDAQLQMETLEKKTELNEISKELAEVCVSDFRCRMDEMLDKFEFQANEAINVRYSNNKASLDKMEGSLEKMKADLEDLKLQLTTQTPDKIILSFISLKKGQKQINDVQQSLSKMKTAWPQTKFSFMLDPTIEEFFFQNIDSIGVIADEEVRNVACSSESVEESASLIQTVTGSDAVDAVSTCDQSVEKLKLSTVRNQCEAMSPKADPPNPHRRQCIQSYADAIVGSYDGNAGDEDCDENNNEVGKSYDDYYDGDHDNDYDDVNNVDEDGDEIDEYVHHVYDIQNARDWRLI